MCYSVMLPVIIYSSELSYITEILLIMLQNKRFEALFISTSQRTKLSKHNLYYMHHYVYTGWY